MDGEAALGEPRVAQSGHEHPQGAGHPPLHQPAQLERALALAPPLTWLALCAAVGDWAIARLLPWMLDVGQASPVAQVLGAAGDLLRNVAVAAGLVTFTLAIRDIMRARALAPTWLRATVAMFGGAFAAAAALALLMPATRGVAALIRLAGLAGATVAVMVASVAGRHARTRAEAITAILGGALALAMAAVLVFELIRGPGGWTLPKWFRGAGEIAFLGLPWAAALHAWPREHEPRAAVRQPMAALVAMGVGVAVMAGAHRLGPDFGKLLYATERLELFISEPATYSVPLAVAFGLPVAALSSPRSRERQVGAGLALFLVAGNVPHSIVAILALVLGVVLLSRGLLARTAAQSGKLPEARDGIAEAS